MSTIIPNGSVNYTELTKNYMGVLYSSKFAEFLNTTQTGYAHSSSGIEFNLLLKTLFTSLCFCTVQLTFFCFFRSIFKYLYQPRCYCVPTNERMDPLPRGFLTWIIPTIKCSNAFYLSMGLDTYFFVRFISILLLFFIVIGVLNMVVLIPVNWTGGAPNNSSVTGLDKLSLSNISISNVDRLNAHFIMSLLTIGIFHWLILYELKSFVIIRLSYLSSTKHENSITARTLLITNVPSYLKDKQTLTQMFEVVPDGIKNVWYIYDFSIIEEDVRRIKIALSTLEKAHTIYFHNFLNSKFKHTICGKDSYNLEETSIQHQMNDELSKFDPNLSPKFYPPIFIGPYDIPKLNREIRFKLPGLFRILLFQKKVYMFDWAIQILNEKLESLDEQKLLLRDDSLLKHDKVIIEFNSQRGSNMAHQCLLSQTQGTLDTSFSEIRPEDILWHNLDRSNSFICLVEKYFVTIVFIAIIILYIVPVSFIGLVSQMPLLTQLMPFLSWLYKLPEEVRETISSFLPSLLLSILTEIVMISFRFLTYFKGKLTGAELELDLQTWYFSFLFVQQFLVVTISSSVTVIFKQILDQPTSIPILLATNLPKAATFFFQYIALKAFAFCGTNFLRIDQLILYHTLYKFKDITPRSKFNRLTNLPIIKWGTTFPIYSVYGSIGIAYSIISPIIAVFIIFILSLTLLYYKYALKYIYSHINQSETQGKLYPIALLHLYTGIYCLEGCLIGIFFLSKNNAGNCPMKIQGWIMIIILLATIFGHNTIYNRYVQHFSYLPILSDKQYKDGNGNGNVNNNLNNNITATMTSQSNQINLPSPQHNQDMLYLHPSFRFEYPRLWLPSDSFGIAEKNIEYIQSRIPKLSDGDTSGANIVFKNHTSKKFSIKISEAPPDYK
ncbi:hypothetical protein DFJ63DRAFT_333086 [Scheffersomyces coipomensis]|uniref:uncharacterized protein n=1 Tax=Scheffersomyces coipomensis TaxID=1788519 RepID=UPI00315D5E61